MLINCIGDERLGPEKSALEWPGVRPTGNQSEEPF